jgi:TetR/AcrR family transcriptional regulator, transcriptional repressor for nem operon
MVRPRQFDRDEVLQKAIRVFWEHGFAGTSTDQLVKELGIGRQSLYNTFGDKRPLYLEALRTYQQHTVSGHLQRLNAPQSPLEGIRQLLLGLAEPDDSTRALGCLGINSVGEFGASDLELVAGRTTVGALLESRLVARIREGQKSDEIDSSISAKKAATFVQMTMSGLQVTARSGASVQALQELAAFTVERLRARPEAS